MVNGQQQFQKTSIAPVYNI